MGEHECRICGEKINPYYGPFQPVNIPGRTEVIKPVDLCSRCIATIVMGTLSPSPSGPAAGAARSELFDFCWFCGNDCRDGNSTWRRIGRMQRDMHICEECSRGMSEEAMRWAGIPIDWRDQPHLCTTCLSERGGECHWAPIAPPPSMPMGLFGKDAVPGIVGMHPKCPKNGGCDSHWHPKLIERK